ncbi:MAG: RHS repeat-associated core domain-containing protein, partial [Chloroflexota bacterium]|nr:RHS repeat-associated core domain-containing protein [Chloroflexota bacterium]
SDGASVYLVGHDTLGGWDGATWAYHLPDALGSVRQEVDGAGAVVSSREWTPFGVEVGTAQAGLGYTGEWWDTYLKLTYLRARWYDGQVGRFTRRDPWEGDKKYSQTLNDFLYADGNPINRVDPSGLCAIVGATDCEKFVSEVRCIIEGIRDARECNTWLRLFFSEEALVLDLLAWYYSGIPFNWKDLYLGWIPQRTVFQQGDRDRWTVPGWDQHGDRPAFTWDHPVNQPGSELGRTMRQSYGFRRPYFENTHHYFAFLKFAYHVGGPPVEWMHKRREIEDQLQDAINRWEEDNPDYPEYYAWMYRESVYDLYIVDEAVKLAFGVAIFGASAIPDCLESKWCANSEADVWALESEVDQLYFEFPQKYWPDEQYWPGR